MERVGKKYVRNVAALWIINSKLDGIVLRRFLKIIFFNDWKFQRISKLLPSLIELSVFSFLKNKKKCFFSPILFSRNHPLTFTSILNKPSNSSKMSCAFSQKS